MAQSDPTATTPLDIVAAALVESGAIGQGQSAGAADQADALARLAWMLQQWQRKRYLVYQLVNFECPMTGALYYFVGPGGGFDTGAGSVRPANVASAYLRQYPLAVGQGGGIGVDFAIGQSHIGGDPLKVPLGGTQPIDFPLEVLKAQEDYNRIRLKYLSTMASAVYYSAGFQLGQLYPWPVPPGGGIYSIVISVLQQLPNNFSTEALQSAEFTLPYEYFFAMVYNLALLLRMKYRIPAFPGDLLPQMAKESLEVLRAVNFQIPTLRMPRSLRSRGSRYNIFGDYST